MASRIPRCRLFLRRSTTAHVWALIQYLRALPESLTAQHLTTRAEPFLPVTAPDFAFEEWPREQETLVQLRGHEVLLVRGRLAGVVATPASIGSAARRPRTVGPSVDPDGGEPRRFPEDAPAGPGMPQLAVVDSDTTRTYAMFSCEVGIPCASHPRTHLELLVDRGGYLRARWLGAPGSGDDRTAEIIAEARRLQREQPRPPAPLEHGH